jgi:hypothetical protein
MVGKAERQIDADEQDLVGDGVEIGAKLESWPGRPRLRRCRESLPCELNCELTGMAKQFSELSVIPKGVAALLNSRSWL